MGCSHSARHQRQKYRIINADTKIKKDPEITERLQNLKPSLVNIDSSPQKNTLIPQPQQPLKVQVQSLHLKISYKNFNYSQSNGQNFPIFIDNKHPVPSQLLQIYNVSEYSINGKHQQTHFLSSV